MLTLAFGDDGLSIIFLTYIRCALIRFSPGHHHVIIDSRRDDRDLTLTRRNAPQQLPRAVSRTRSSARVPPRMACAAKPRHSSAVDYAAS